MLTKTINQNDGRVIFGRITSLRTPPSHNSSM
jgi:hypothetical protein